jgi:hypothetical protein
MCPTRPHGSNSRRYGLPATMAKDPPTGEQVVGVPGRIDPGKVQTSSRGPCGSRATTATTRTSTDRQSDLTSAWQIVLDRGRGGTTT